MSCLAYTVEELLQLRGKMEPSALPTTAAPVLTQAPAPGKCKPPAEEQPTKGRPSEVKRPDEKPKVAVEVNNNVVKKAAESSSNGSDEIVYKGNPTRRGGPVETEWKYRGRSGSEVVANEPVSAPAGVRAQQSEGFQRFYKAVVSPTHVRVTAGGRIVPNTRGTSSPTVKRVKDKPMDAQSETVQTATASQSESGANGGQGPGVPMFAMPPHFYAPFGPALPHLNAGMPMMPMPMGLGMPGAFPYAHPALNGAFSNAVPNGEKGAKENIGQKVSDEENSGAAEETATANADKGDNVTKGSSTEQHEQPKPFMFNGQLMYPMAPGYPGQMAPPFMAPGFLGPHGYPMPPYGMPMMGTPPFNMNHMAGPMGGFGHAQPQPPAPVQATTSVRATSASKVNLPAVAPLPTPATNRQPPSNPPISSIRPSEISRKQIETLRSSLKYHEDQLQYNKHQIDEKECEKTIRMLSQEIQRFEGLHQTQLLHEEQNYPKRESSQEGVAQTVPQTVALAQTPKMDENRIDTESQGGSRHGSHREKRGLRFRPGLIPTSQGLNTSQSHEAALKLDKLDLSVQVGEPVRKSSLPSGAALAPPFQPRGKSAFGTTPTLADGLHGIEAATSGVDKHFMPTGMDNWGGWLTSSTNGFLDGPGSTEAETPITSRPYLVGVLPDHVNPKTARDADYVYGRELTDEELRARFLYWGRAPMSARQGLPKYDGKHFYPPSPMKQVNGQDQLGSCVSGTVPAFASVDPFRPMTPVNGAQAAKMLASKENTPPKQAEDTRNSGPIRGKTVSEALESSDNGIGTKAGNKIINNMLKRGITRSTDVLPSEISATTAHGFLPQYTSYGTMTHSEDTTTTSSDALDDVSPSKSSDGGGVLLTPVAKRGGENRAAATNPGVSSLEEQFRNIVSNDTKNRAGLPAHWKA